MNYFSGIWGLFIAVSYFAASCRIVVSFWQDYDQDLCYKGIWKVSALEYIIHLSYKWGKKKLEKKEIMGILITSMLPPDEMWTFIPSPDTAFSSPEMCPTPKPIYKTYCKTGSR